MKKFLLFLVCLIAVRTVVAQDIDAMAKWTAYQIVHYKVVGEFSGEVLVFKGAKGFSARAAASDRIEVEFDWNQQEFNLVGKPVIRNFPTKLGALIPPTKCGPPTVKGTFEHVTGLELTAPEALRMSGALVINVRRDLPGGAIPHQDEDEKCSAVDVAAATSETATLGIMAIPGMFLAMPAAATKEMSVTPDKKSIVSAPGQKGASNYGWTWTYTPTGVK
jgi:hypothetical protein